MCRYRTKLFYLVLACGFLPAWLLQCDKAALNLQRGFWAGLGQNLSEILTTSAVPT